MAKPSFQKFSFKDYPIEDISSLRIGIVNTEWNQEIIDRLTSSCSETLLHFGILKENVVIVTVPGSFELPLGAKMLLSGSPKTDAVICLGCVIKGETQHDEYINHSISKSISQLNLVSGVPIIFGVLTTLNIDQAKERSGGKHGNKGKESALAALKMISLKERIARQNKKISF